MKPLPSAFACVACLAFAATAGAGGTQPASGDVANLRTQIAIERGRAPAPRLPRADFLLKSRVVSPVLSPDGRQLAWLQARDNGLSVWMQATTPGAKPRRLLEHTDARSLYWTHDSRWLLLETPSQLFALAAAGQTGSGAIAELGGNLQRRLLEVDPVRPAAVLLLEHTRARIGQPQRWRLLRTDMHGGSTTLYADSQQIVDAAFNADGHLTYLSRVEGSTITLNRVDAQGDLHVIAGCEQLHRCTLLPVTDPQGDLLLETDLDGNLLRLASMDAHGVMHTLHEDPRGVADLDTLTLDPVNGQPLIASYRSIVPANYGLTAAVQNRITAIDQHYPGRNLDITVGVGPDAHWLIGEQASDQQAERWHLYDPRDGAMHDVMDFPPRPGRDGKPAKWLPDAALARKLPFTWTASDGMRVHGFVWLPPGRDPASLPLVAMVHGGPWNHVHADAFGGGFSQFLANRGYIVFEPNFRSSTSYGRDYTFAAHGDFGNGRVQRDIVEGVRALLAQGIGDAQRVGIVGGSFGGYSTLLGVTFQPELFKVGVAIVPPPDFAWDLHWISRSSEALNLSRYIPFKDWLRMLSLDLDDKTAMARLHAQSPLANADKLHRPLLIFASGEDHRVALRGVLGYAAKLQQLHKDVSLFVDPTAGHVNYTPLSSEAYLYLLALMLHDHLGGAAPSPLDPALHTYLCRNLRIASPEVSGVCAPRAQH